MQAVGSPAEALELLMSDGEGFDLVLLDYRLPGTDGLRCAAQVMERHPGLGVGLMSGADDPTLGHRAQDAGLVAYLPKTLEVPACSPNCASWPRASPPLPMPRGLPMPTGHPPAPTA